jgi:hypothetical protein
VEVPFEGRASEVGDGMFGDVGAFEVEEGSNDNAPAIPVVELVESTVEVGELGLEGKGDRSGYGLGGFLEVDNGVVGSSQGIADGLEFGSGDEVRVWLWVRVQASSGIGGGHDLSGSGQWELEGVRKGV